MRTFLLAAALGAAALAPVGAATVAAAGDPVVICRGERATVVGTDDRDRLVGTAGRDVIAGLGGNDVVRGRGGDDVLCGGKGSDQLDGGPGDDRLYGGPDLGERGPTPYHRGDFLTGGPGDDLLAAGYDARWADLGGGDLVSWTDAPRAVQVDLAEGTATGHGRDRVRLQDGRSLLTQYDDTFVGSSSRDEVHGLGGTDDISTGPGHDQVWLDDVEEVDDDRAVTGPGRDTVHSTGGSDVVRSQAGRDVVLLVGDQGMAQTWTGSGDDHVEVQLHGGGENVVAGGSGRDRLLLELMDSEPQHHTYDMSTGQLLLGDQFPASLPEFEDVELYQGHFTVLGTDGADRVVVNLAGDFSGGDGDDTYVGGDGDDTYDGGPGEDTYAGDLGGTNTCTSVEHDVYGWCAGP